MRLSPAAQEFQERAVSAIGGLVALFVVVGLFVLRG